MCQHGKIRSEVERSVLSACDNLMAALDEAIDTAPGLYAEISELLIASVRVLGKRSCGDETGQGPSPLERALLDTCDDLMAALDEAMETEPQHVFGIGGLLVTAVTLLDKCPIEKKQCPPA